MPHLNRFQTLIEWAISLLCAVGAAILIVQQQPVDAFILFAFGLAINPIVKANILIKICFALLASVIIFHR